MTKQSHSKSQDAIQLLTDDHKKVQKLFKDFEKLAKQEDEDGKDELAQQICAELTVHSQIEEEIFYPVARDALDDQMLVDEAEVEHASAKELIDQIESMQAGEELFDAKVLVLGEYVNHHIKEEQDEIFPKIKKAKLDLDSLGEELMQRKVELMSELGMDELIEGGKPSGGGGKRKQESRRSSASRH